MDLLALSIGKTKINAPGGMPTLSSGTSGINELIGVAFDVLFILAVILTLVYLIWGGIDYITSTGSKEKMNSAKNKIRNAIIGLCVTFLALFMIRMVGYIFNVKLY